MEFLNSWLVPSITGFCLVIGYLFKCIPITDNRFIPVVVCLIGVALAIWLNWPAVSLDCILSGALSGLASTGMYELFSQWISKGGD